MALNIEGCKIAIAAATKETVMAGVGAIESLSGGVGAAASSEADALVHQATSNGSLDIHALAAEVAKLTPDQQRDVKTALSSRLSPLQEGQFQRASSQLSPHATDADLPKEYVRGRDGTLQLSPEYARTACDNYNKMMTSNSHVGDVLNFGFGGATVATAGSNAAKNALGGAVGGPLTVMGAMGGMVTGLLAHAEPPPGCEKK